MIDRVVTFLDRIGIFTAAWTLLIWVWVILAS
jgi:hypothetical protein